MAAAAIAEVSKVKSQSVWPDSPLHHKAQVRFMPAPGPAHIFVMVCEFFFVQKHTETEKTLILRRDWEPDRSRSSSSLPAQTLFILTETLQLLVNV